MADKEELERIKRRAEALLFVRQQISEDEFVKMLRLSGDKTLLENVLESLARDYKSINSAIQVVKRGLTWRMMISDELLSLVRRFAGAELPKSLLETLAYIAVKVPVKQSQVVKVRTNKAYEHIKRLKEEEFITLEDFENTKMIRLSHKFYEYFQVEPGADVSKRLIEQAGKSQKAVVLEEKPIIEFKEEKKEEEQQQTSQ